MENLLLQLFLNKKNLQSVQFYTLSGKWHDKKMMTDFLATGLNVQMFQNYSEQITHFLILLNDGQVCFLMFQIDYFIA